VISTASAIVDAAGVLREVRSAPPLTLRQVRAEQDGLCALCLIGSAAGPLPGDQLTLRLDVRPGAQGSLVATGATIAQGRSSPAGGDQPARIQIIVTVAERASLDADPGALIVCAGSRVEVEVRIRLAEDARLRWREVVVLGRSDEVPGQATLDWDVRRAGRPLLRQHIDLTDPGHTRWPGLFGPHRVLDTELLVGRDIDASTTVHNPMHVTQRLAEHATLTTRLLS
jgi:urease accessory protein